MFDLRSLPFNDGPRVPKAWRTEFFESPTCNTLERQLETTRRVFSAPPPRLRPGPPRHFGYVTGYV